CANSQPAPQSHSDNEAVSSLDYQECIQAAISGNGQASSAKCDPILKAPR
ncbi:MAG: ChiQ/YbfN family lipoprotein, partial [Kluyvera intermedia]